MSPCSYSEKEKTGPQQNNKIQDQIKNNLEKSSEKSGIIEDVMIDSVRTSEDSQS